jgi:transposase, IS5 family
LRYNARMSLRHRRNRRLKNSAEQPAASPVIAGVPPLTEPADRVRWETLLGIELDAPLGDVDAAPRTTTVDKSSVKESFKIKGLSFFDASDQVLDKLERMGDPLVRLQLEIDWELFRPDLARVYQKESKSAAGRKPLDVVLMFKVVMLQRLYNLSDDQTEYQIRDRRSFQRFLGLNSEDGAPDAKTLWLFKERLKEFGLERDLFFRFEMYLREKGLEAKGGQIIDATFVDVPRQRNTREENEIIKSGGWPEGWKEQPHMLAQKDLDAEWAKKGDETHYGYKDHTNVDEKYKLIRDYTVTGASVHDSRMADDILDTDVVAASTEVSAEAAVSAGCSEGEATTPSLSRPLYADSAYRSAAIEASLEEQGVPSRVHERAYKNVALTDEQKTANREKSRVRCRVEHVYGYFHTSMNRATFIRTIGSARACLVIGLSNLGYNLARFLQITKAKPQAAG